MSLIALIFIVLSILKKKKNRLTIGAEELKEKNIIYKAEMYQV